MAKTVLGEWDSLERAIMPPSAPATQRREMRKAFVAGALAMFALVSELSDLPEEQAVEGMERLRKECMDFGQGVADGRF